MCVCIFLKSFYIGVRCLVYYRFFHSDKYYMIIGSDFYAQNIIKIRYSAKCTKKPVVNIFFKLETVA